jgi:hypothetical protein
MRLEERVQTTPKTPRRHRTFISFGDFVSFGDANLLDGVDDITTRESGYQITGRKKRTHPFFKPPPSETAELKEKGGNEEDEDLEYQVTAPRQNLTDRKPPPPLPSLFQPQLKGYDFDEENAPKSIESLDADLEGKDDEESSQNIQINSGTLPRQNTSKASSPPLASLFQPPLQQTNDDDEKQKLNL